ncbi:hypothetical protein FACS189476_09500 [Spirochaetia bacterium]|nr:hypothetical protein FACS189476_09500 [Spirochaetia bacterium]
MAIAFSVAALILGSVLVGLAGCQMGPTDGLDLGGTGTLTLDTGRTTTGGYPGDAPPPPKLPYARIIEGLAFDPTGNPLGWNDTQFVLEWRPSAGADQQAIDDAAIAALEKWLEYMAKVNPRPFVDDYSDGLFDTTKKTDVLLIASGGAGTTVRINESNVVIHRYWPAPLGSPPTTWDPFIATAAVRERDYNTAVAEIKAMRTAIQASPFYAAGNHLDALFLAMGSAVPDPTAGSTAPSGQQTDWGTFDGNSLELSGGEGFLYQYYLGYIPKPSDWKPGVVVGMVLDR